MSDTRAERVDLDGQVVLVTGAGRGLGRAYALLVAERGARVVVHDAGVDRDGRGGDPAVVERVVDEIAARGGDAVGSRENLAGREGCEALVAGAVERFGRLDALVCNAGVVEFAPIAETAPDAWERMMQVNIAAPFWLCRAAWPTLRRQAYGRIVLTVSGVALSVDRATDDLAAYSMGKAAQFGLMNALAAEGAAHGILVNAVSPVATTRMSRDPVSADALAPAHVAPLAAFFASRSCRVSGVVVRAAGGRFSSGAYVYGPEVDLGSEPVSPETVAALLPDLLEAR